MRSTEMRAYRCFVAHARRDLPGFGFAAVPLIDARRVIATSLAGGIGDVTGT